MNIDIYDDVMSYEENIKLYNQILYSLEFKYGEVDNEGLPPTGMVYEISLNDPLYDVFHNIVISKNPTIANLKSKRSYINLFFPNEKPYFHIDGNVITCLFYITPKYDINMGGETQFVEEGRGIIGVPSKPARLVIFDGKILHKATSFRSKPRITVALKYLVG
jgi:hypothetical protein